MSKPPRRLAIGSALALLIGPRLAAAPPGEGEAKRGAGAPMTNARLDALIRRLDPEAKGGAGFWRLTVESREVLVITDEKADRMGVMTEVAKAGDLDRKNLYRLLQANFDTALDARYSIAKDTLWSAFIHPLGSLRDEQFLAAIGQVVNLAATHGTTYSSGLLVFRGGDSGELQRRELIERLLKKGLGI